MAKQFLLASDIQENDLSFEQVVKPVMAWLAKNKHPHMSIIIDSTRAELVEGVECVATDEFVQD
jgi:hypothetical protein